MAGFKPWIFNIMKTLLDWSAYQDAGMGDAYADIPKTGGNFAKAVAVCINSRACESNNHKMVMCPSFRVSDELNHSTGGRVRLLKAALNGELGAAPFDDPVLADAMALCIGCKGCKRECENEVDMAMIKLEYMAQRQADTGISLRSRLFAELPRILYRYPWVKGLIAQRNRFVWLAKWGERLLGISAERRLPEPARLPFSVEKTIEPAGTGAQGREVVLFVDTFTRYFDPDIAVAAQTVLEAAGYLVITAKPVTEAGEPVRPLCCGRTWLAQGMIDAARAEAERVLTALLPHARAGRAIIGLEPSCLLSLRDEYRFLGLGDAALEVARSALLFEEFVARESAAKAFNAVFKPSDMVEFTLVHGHCHQKAVGAMKSMRKVLKLIPDFQFELIESSCCGMAGSFGLEAEHAEIAQAMAEQSLLPALRVAPEAQVVANGFSCRHQIRLGARREGLHVAQVLRAALVS
jgi:glycerol-3-phosphate dehydrogenase subunit C